MIILEEQFSPRVNPADANYPFGSIKDNTSPGANDGTPLAAVWGNDWEGFAQAAMTEAGITPSGLPDTAQDSQLLAAVKVVTSGMLRDELAAPGGSDIVGFQQYGSGSVPRTAQDKMRDTISVADYDTQQHAIDGAISSGAIFHNNVSTFTITVGDGGNATSINAALELADRLRPRYKVGNAQCEIKLLSGFVMREQVLLDGGVDFGWVKITAVDAITTIDNTYVTIELTDEDNVTPAFGAKNNSALPTIGCKFQYPTGGAGVCDGVAVHFGSKVGFLPNTGILGCRRGIQALYSSEVYCYMPGLTQGGGGTGAGTVPGVDFSGCTNRALHVAYHSRAGLARSNFSQCAADATVYVIWGSSADIYQSNMSYSANEAVLCRDGSTVNARETNVSHSSVGYHALHGARINARSRISTNPEFPVWVGEGAKYCSNYAVLASYNSHIDAPELMCDNNTHWTAVHASNASSINFVNGSATNCSGIGVSAYGASVIDATRAILTGAGDKAILARGVSSISAPYAVGTGCGDTAVLAQEGSSIDISNGDFSGAVNFGALAIQGGEINAINANLGTTKRAVEAREGSSIEARSGNLSNCSERGVSAIDGGRINCISATVNNCPSFAITCRGGEVVALSATCNVNGAHVTIGGIIKFAGATGTVSQAVNTITANGIIFQ